MTDAVTMIFEMIALAYNELNSVQFEFFGQSVGLASIMLCMVIVSIVCTVFWKGARG